MLLLAQLTVMNIIVVINASVIIVIVIVIVIVINVIVVINVSETARELTVINAYNEQHK